MRETLTVSTWNSKGAFSDARRAESAFEAITAAKPTIIALPDAWHEDSNYSPPPITEIVLLQIRLLRRQVTILWLPHFKKIAPTITMHAMDS